MQLLRRFQYIKLIAADFGAALVAWMCFYLLRKYLLNEMTGYHFTEGALFDLTGSAVVIAIFWTMLYTLVGEYRDVFRKSRLAEIIRLARVSLLGAVYAIGLLGICLHGPDGEAFLAGAGVLPTGAHRQKRPSVQHH